MTDTLLPLRGIHCKRCQHVATPIQHFGCESCGAHDDDVIDTELAGDGTVLNAVTVHRAENHSLRIGSVHLDEGPMVRARLSSEAVAGIRVRATEYDGSVLFVEFEEAH